MAHDLRGVTFALLTLFASVTVSASAMAQIDQGKQLDPVQKAMQKYQLKVDQLERLTKRVLDERKQQLEETAARLRKHEDEAAALTRRLQTVETRNKQLDSQVAQLRNELRAADAERNRLQRSLAKRQAETQVRREQPAKTPDTKTPDTSRPDTNIRARLHRMEDQAAEMEQWIRRLQRDLRSVRRRREL